MLSRVSLSSSAGLAATRAPAVAAVAASSVARYATDNASLTMAKRDEAFAALGMSEEEQGVFDGSQWAASGEWQESVCPATGLVLGKVKAGTTEDYERCVYVSFFFFFFFFFFFSSCRVLFCLAVPASVD